MSGIPLNFLLFFFSKVTLLLACVTVHGGLQGDRYVQIIGIIFILATFSFVLNSFIKIWAKRFYFIDFVSKFL